MSSNALREIIAFFGIEVDDKQLKKGEHGVHGFTETLKEFGETLISAFAVEKIVDFTKELLEEADVLAKQSIALSVSTAELQGWQFAAKLSGSSAEEFNSAFTKFNRNVAGASKGTGPAADALHALGVTAEELKTKLPVELLDDVADGLVKMQDPAKRTETIMALFGKSGAKLLPLFLEGADGIKKLRAEVGELGATFDEAFLQDAQEVNDNIDRLKLGVKGLAIQAIGPLLPDIVAITEGGIKWIKWVIDLLKHSNALKAALVVFGSVAVAKTATGLVSLAQKAGFLKNGFRGLLLQVLPLVAAFLVLEDVWTFLTGGKSVTGDLIAKFFGKDAPGKVREFVSALKDTGLADFATLLSTAFAIFTDDKKPLDAKFKALLAYISGPFTAQLTKDFGGVGTEIGRWVEDLGAVLDVLAKIITAMDWIGTHTVNAVGKALFNAQDGAANEQAKLDAGAAAGEPVTTADDLRSDWGKRPLWQRAIGHVLGADNFDKMAPQDLRKQIATANPEGVVPTAAQASAQATTASAPVPFGPPQAPAAQVHNETHLVQNIDASTPKAVQDAAAEGAKKGVSDGNNLRTQRALVPTG